MLCPHCLKEVQLALGSVDASVGWMKIEQGIGKPAHHVHGALCPACSGLIVMYSDPRSHVMPGSGLTKPKDDQSGVIFPRRPALKPLPPEVPTEYRGDFDEARLVVELSPKSSAALSRRLLQRVLHERFNINRPNLQQEIQEFISTLGPPSHLIQQLDAVRLVGNFAAHPIKDTNTGAITDVEEGEAELLIETLESLFDFAFVQPAKWAASKAAINAKLSAAGKPLIS